MNKLIRFVLTLTVFLILAACSFNIGQPTPVPTGAPLAVVPTRTPVALAPTATARPTRTPLPFPTPVTLPIVPATSIPQAGLPLIGARVYAVGPLGDDQTLVTIQALNALPGRYQAQIGARPYRCEILESYPDRLYCRGPQLPPGSTSFITVQAEGSSVPVYQAYFFVPVIAE